MATVLEKYYGLQHELEKCMAQPPVNVSYVWYYGEIVYRISVLQNCQMFLCSAPATTEIPTLLGHYQMLDAFVQGLALERRYGPGRGPDTQKERAAAQANLSRVINDYRKRFSGFNPTSAQSYQKEVSKVITTLLAAWLQYRNTFVPIKRQEEQAQ